MLCGTIPPQSDTQMLYVDVGSYYKQHIPVKDLYGPSTSAYGLVKVSNRVKMSASLHVPLNVRRLRPVFQGVGAMTIMFANFPVIFMLTQLHFFSGAFHRVVYTASAYPSR